MIPFEESLRKWNKVGLGVEYFLFCYKIHRFDRSASA